MGVSSVVFLLLLHSLVLSPTLSFSGHLASVFYCGTSTFPRVSNAINLALRLFSTIVYLRVNPGCSEADAGIP
jgi:hypothetical protein